MPVILFRDFDAPPDQIIRVAVTGHMIDRGEQQRFPEAFISRAWGGLSFWLKGLHSVYGRQLRLFTSASAGVDLLAIAIALTKGIPADVFLPQAEAPFLDRSVAYGTHAEQWLQIYQAARAALSVTIHEPMDTAAAERLYFAPPGSKQHYADLNVVLGQLLRPGTGDRLIAV